MVSARLQHVFAIFTCTLEICYQVLASSPCENIRVTDKHLCNLTINSPDVCFVLPSNYDATKPPKINGRTVNVTVDVSIDAITRIRETDLDMDVTFILRFTWFDCRLLPIAEEGILLSEEGMKKLWQPDVHFRNTKQWTVFDRVLAKPSDIISSDKLLFRSNRYLATVICSFNFRKYPFDKQICTLELESYSRTKKDVTLVLNGIKFDEKMPVLPQYDVKNITGTNCEVKWSLGKFSDIYACVGVTVHFERRYNFYLWKIYFPSIILVCISWLSFWIDTNAVPGRVALGITTLLTLSTQFLSIQQSLPPVSYLKAVDVWMFACMVFVFLSLVEFVVAYSWQNKIPFGKDLKLKFWKENSKVNFMPDPYMVEVHTKNCSDVTLNQGDLPLRLLNNPLYVKYRKGSEQSNVVKSGTQSLQVSRNVIDQYAILIYVFSFAVFNFVYWTAYLC